MNEPARHHVQSQSEASLPRFLTALPLAFLATALVCLFALAIDPPTNVVLALLLTIGFWGAGSLRAIRDQSQEAARELRSVAAGMAGGGVGSLL
jgi:hypothetical protein